MPIPPIVVHFAAAGVQEVKSAFASVSSQIRKFEEQATRENERGGRARGAATRSEVGAIERSYAKLVRDVEKFERQQTKEAEKEAKRREDATKHSLQQTERNYAKLVREVEKSERQTTRAVEREEERKMRIRIRSSEMAGRAAAREAAEEVRAAEKASRARSTAGRKIGGIVSGSVGSLIGGVGSMVGATLGLGGGFMLANAARQQFSAEHTAALLVNAGTTGGVAPGTTRDALKAASEESIRTGISKETLLGSALKYSQSAKGGDFRGALANMGMFADLAKVTGADITDVAESAGILQSQNKELQGEGGAAKMREMMLTVLGGTHEGTMSFVDVARQMGVMGSTRSSFAQDQGRSQLSLIGMAQIARTGGDVGEAGTFVKDLSLEASMANKKWREMKDAHGVKHTKDLITMDAHGQMQSPEQMVADVLRGTGGKIDVINDLMGKRGGAFFRESYADYLKGEKTGGVEGGIAGVIGSVKKITGAAVTESQFASQVKTVDETPGAKFQIALNKITETVEEKLEPRLAHFADDTLPKLMPQFEKIINAAAGFADWFADNPIKGVGAIVLAKVGADLLQARIGEGVKKILSTILKNAVGGGPGTAIAVPIAASLAAYTAETSAIEEDTDASKRTSTTAAARIKMAADIEKKLASGGKITHEDALKLNSIRNAARADVQAATEQVGKTNAGFVAVGASELVSMATGRPSLADATIKEQQQAALAATKAFADVSKAATDVAAKLKALDASTPKSVPTVPGVQPGAPTVPIPQRTTGAH